MPDKQEPLEITMVFDASGYSDDFAQQCLAGGKKAAHDFGLKFTEVKGVSPLEIEGLQARMARKGDNLLVITIGGNQDGALRRTAASYPGQMFAGIDSAIYDMPNVAAIVFRDDESSFLAGALSIMVSRTGRLGFIGGMDIAAIRRFFNGFSAGARAINPAALVSASWVGSWDDATRGRILAQSAYESGADVIFAAAGASGVGVITAAHERGKYVIGVDVDQRPLAPDNVLISVIKNVDAGVYRMIDEARQGKLASGAQFFGLKDGAVDITLDNAHSAVSPEIKTHLATLKGDIINGKTRIDGRGVRP
ncbi:MAG: BMP family ABC transporter substrate-binding protein [Dehalococcoidales bacterium]|nr:BMP family ABC transporter substrate-binding protein [Dehalococcoidales bacterium]